MSGGTGPDAPAAQEEAMPVLHEEDPEQTAARLADEEVDRLFVEAPARPRRGRHGSVGRS